MPERVQAKLYLRDHTEVAPSAAQSPEQIRVLFVACMNNRPIRRDQLGAQDVVTGQAVLCRQVTNAAPQTQPHDTG